MTRLIPLAFGVGLALVTIGLAYAGDPVAGTWRLTLGASHAPCVVTLTADGSGRGGTVESASDCPDAANAWKATATGIDLYAGGGALVASLKPQGDGYVGRRYSDDRKLALDR